MPGSPTVVGAQPLRLTGMLNQALRLPTEIELDQPSEQEVSGFWIASRSVDPLAAA
jgi:hypothetical protein